MRFLALQLLWCRSVYGLTEPTPILVSWVAEPPYTKVSIVCHSCTNITVGEHSGANMLSLSMNSLDSADLDIFYCLAIDACGSIQAPHKFERLCPPYPECRWCYDTLVYGRCTSPEIYTATNILILATVIILFYLSFAVIAPILTVTLPVVRGSAKGVYGIGNFLARSTVYVYTLVLSLKATKVEGTCPAVAPFYPSYPKQVSNSTGVNATFVTLASPGCSYTYFDDGIGGVSRNLVTCTCAGTEKTSSTPAYTARLTLTVNTDNSSESWSTPISVTNTVMDGQCSNNGASLCTGPAPFCGTDFDSLSAATTTVSTTGANVFLMGNVGFTGGQEVSLYECDMAFVVCTLDSDLSQSQLTAEITNVKIVANVLSQSGQVLYGLPGMTLVEVTDGLQQGTYLESWLTSLSPPLNAIHPCGVGTKRPMNVQILRCTDIFGFNILDSMYHFIFVRPSTFSGWDSEPSAPVCFLNYPASTCTANSNIFSGRPISIFSWISSWTPTISMGYEHMSVTSEAWGIPAFAANTRDRVASAFITAGACNAIPTYGRGTELQRVRCLTRMFIRIVMMEGQDPASVSMLMSYNTDEAYSGTLAAWVPDQSQLFRAIAACSSCTQRTLPLDTAVSWSNPNNCHIGTFGFTASYSGGFSTATRGGCCCTGDGRGQASDIILRHNNNDAPQFWMANAFGNNAGSETTGNIWSPGDMNTIMPLSMWNGASSPGFNIYTLTTDEVAVFVATWRDTHINEASCNVNSFTPNPVFLSGFGFLDCEDWPELRYVFGGPTSGSLPNSVVCPGVISTDACSAPRADDCGLGRQVPGSFMVREPAYTKPLQSTSVIGVPMQRDQNLNPFFEVPTDPIILSITLIGGVGANFYGPVGGPLLTGNGAQVGSTIGIIGVSEEFLVSFRAPCSPDGNLVILPRSGQGYKITGELGCPCTFGVMLCANVSMTLYGTSVLVSLDSYDGSVIATRTVNINTQEFDPSNGAGGTSRQETVPAADGPCITCWADDLLKALGGIWGSLILTLIGIVIFILFIVLPIYLIVRFACGGVSAKKPQKPKQSQE